MKHLKEYLTKLTFLAILAFLPQLASAYDFMVDGLCYNKNSNGTSVTLTYKQSPNSSVNNVAYANLSGNITIPANVTHSGKTYSVTLIGSSAFYNCSGLTSVTIPSSVTSIGSSAFYNCSGLTSVTIPSSVTSIGTHAFSGCSGLTSVTIPNSVTSIGEYAFYYCSGLTSVNITDLAAWCNIVFSSYANPLYYAHNLYLNGSKVTNLVIPNTVTSIKPYTFDGCSGLTSVTIPNLVTTIGKCAFWGCSGLTSVTIPNSVTSIGDNAFDGCSGLTSVTIGNSVTSIGNNAFIGCSGLTSIVVESGNTKYDSRNNCNAIIETANNTLICGCKNTLIPNSVTSIGGYAFYNCSGLTSVTIPNSVTSIGFCAFYNCTGLTSVTIGNSVKTIGKDAFYGTTWYNNQPDGLVYAGMVAYKYKGTMPNSTSIVLKNGCTGITEHCFYGCSGLTSVTIGNSVTSIGNNAFCGCSGLTSVTIGNSVTSIGNNAFSGCSGLTSVTIPNSVTSIGFSVFYNCTGLTSVTIPNSVTSIGSSAFYNCSGLTSLTLTGQGAFNPKNNMPSISKIKTLNIGSGITSLGSFGIAPDVVNCYAEVPPTCSSGTFTNYDGQLHVPSVSTAAYFMADYWQNFLNMSNDLTGKVTLSQNNASMLQWQTMTLAATTNPEGANVLWGTTDPLVAAIDDNGVVTATGGGECDIFATLESNSAVYASCHASVSYPEIAISLNYNEIEMKYGEDTTLVATITPNNTGLTPTWASSDISVATVENGVVTAVGEGECDITATVLGMTATCHLVVDEVTISLNYSEIEMKYGEDTTLVAIIDPDNGSLAPIWASSDESVATVENGLVTAVGEGECDITAIVIDKTATCHVIVNSNTIIITLSNDNAIIGANQLLTIYPSCTPDIPVELVVTSSDSTVAVARVVNRANTPVDELLSFSEKGMAIAQSEKIASSGNSKEPSLASEKAIMIVGVQNGTATITVTTADGKVVPAMFELRVVDVDGDNVVTATDVTSIYDYLLNNNMNYYNTSDIDGDNYITANDVTTLYEILLGNPPLGYKAYVDLGLPSGTLWATRNVGASTPNDYGYYFAWGETQPKDVYNWGTYNWCNGSSTKLTKYCTNSSFGNNGFVDNKTVLDPEDDAATANWGPAWCMPTKEQQDELLAECTWQWTTQNGVNGYLVTSKHNRASLFLPAAGTLNGTTLSNAGSRGTYWSRTLYADSPRNANYLYFYSDDAHWEYYGRQYGFTVRAVRTTKK